MFAARFLSSGRLLCSSNPRRFLVSGSAYRFHPIVEMVFCRQWVVKASGEDVLLAQMLWEKIPSASVSSDRHKESHQVVDPAMDQYA